MAPFHTLVSVRDGQLHQPSLSQRASISGDGRYVVFTSEATNLVDGDDEGAQDVFIKDLATGEITRISEAEGAGANADSFDPVISADGRYVVFWTMATDLPGNVPNQFDLYRYDRTTGTLEHVSEFSAPLYSGGGTAVLPYALSADGRYIVMSNNPPGGDSQFVYDIILKDMDSGTVTVVSRDVNGGQPNDHSYAPSISADGRYVVYSSFATDIVANDGNAGWDLFLFDVQLQTTTLVSTSAGGARANASAYEGRLSADGRWLVFESNATNLIDDVADANGTVPDIFVKDLETGVVRLVSSAADGTQGNSASRFGAISPDGRYVAFFSQSSNLVTTGEPDGGVSDIFVKDLVTGAIRMVNIRADGTSTGALNTSNTLSFSADGRYLVFDYGLAFPNEPALVPGDANSAIDVVVADLFSSAVRPVVSIAVAPALATEGAAFTITVTRAGPDLSLPSTVSYAITGPAADAGDITSPLSGTITIAAGETSAILDLMTLDDAVVEPDESFTVTIADPVNATLGTSTATATIIDNDEPPVVSIALEPASVTEGGTFTLTATRTGNLDRASRVVIDPSGVAGAQDIDLSWSTPLDFAPGQSVITRTITTLDDTLTEDAESFSITIFAADNAAIGTGSATGTIIDDDRVPVVSISIAPDSRIEGSGNFTLTATREGDLTLPSTVTLGFSGPAGNPGDLNFLPTSIDFAAGQDTVTVLISSLGDFIFEGNESFTISIVDTFNASVGTGSATATIIDDDIPRIEIVPFGDPVVPAGYAVDEPLRIARIDLIGGTGAVSLAGANAGVFAIEQDDTGRYLTILPAATAILATPGELGVEISATIDGLYEVSASYGVTAETVLPDDFVPLPNVYPATSAMRVVTYSFQNAGGTSPLFSGGSLPFSEEEKAIARSALQAWDAASGLIFVEVPSGEGNLKIYLSNGVPATEAGASEFGLPTQLFAGGSTSIVINPGEGSNFETYAHEIGHALSLHHSFPEQATGATGVRPLIDNTSFTVMSYTNGLVGFQDLAALGPLDIDAARYLFGAPETGTVTTTYDAATHRGTISWTGSSGVDQIATADLFNPRFSVTSLTGGAGDDTLAVSTPTRIVFSGVSTDYRIDWLNPAIPGGAGTLRLTDQRSGANDGSDTISATVQTLMGTSFQFGSSLVRFDELMGIAVSDVSFSMNGIDVVDSITVPENVAYLDSIGSIISWQFANPYNVTGLPQPIFQIFNSGEVPFSLVGTTFRASNTSGPFDFDVTPSFDVVVRAYGFGDEPYQEVLTINVARVNEAPREVVLVGPVTGQSNGSIDENATVGTGIKVADVFVLDDDDGTNVLALSGADAASFELRGGELYFIGASPDFETKASYKVSVTADDPELGTGVEATSEIFTLAVNDVSEPPEVSISIAPGRALEGASFRLIAVRSGGDLSQPSTVAYTITGDAAGASDITSPLTGTIIFAPFATVQDVEIQTAGDALVEPDEGFTVTLSAPRNATIGTGTATATILDDDVLPEISLQFTTASVSEGGVLFLRATRTGPLDLASSATYTLSGAAGTAGDIAGPLTGAIAFAPFVPEILIPIATVEDGWREPDETLVATLTAPVGATLATASASAVIVNDDALSTSVLAFLSPSAARSEGDPITLILNRAGDTSSAAIVDYTIAGAAAKPADISTPLTGSVTFAAGSATASLTIATVEDLTPEPNESFLILLAPREPHLVMSTPVISGAITNDDFPVVVSLDRTSVPEGGAFLLRATRSGDVTASLTLDYKITGQAASAGDIATPLAGTLHFGPGQAQASLTIATIDDFLVEPSESFKVELTSPDGAPVQGATSGIIANNDSPPSLWLSLSSAEISEGDTVTLTARRAGLDLSQASTVAYTLSGLAVTRGLIMSPVQGTFTFAPGQTEASVTVSTLEDDVLGRAARTPFDVTLSSAVNASIVGGVASATIVEDDVLPVITVALDQEYHSEGDAFTLIVTRTGSLNAPLSTSYTIFGPAANGNDLLTPLTGTVTFGSGQDTAELVIEIRDDVRREANEAFSVRLDPIPGQPFSIINSVRTASGTILDDDGVNAPPVVSISLAAEDARPDAVGPANQVEEGEAFLLTATRTGGDIAAETVVSYVISGFNGLDISADIATPLTGTLTFAPFTDTVTLRIVTVDDGIRDSTTAIERFSIDIVQTRNAQIGTGSAIGRILDNDIPTYSVALDQSWVVEGESFVLTATRTGPLDQAVEISYDMIGAAATGGDLDLARTGLVKFAAGSATATVLIPTKEDSAAEGDETFTFRVGGAPGARVTGTVVNDDGPLAPPRVTASLSPDQGVEGTVFALTVERIGGDLSQPTSVDYEIFGKGANALDFSSSLSGTVTIPSGARSVVLDLVSIDDAVIDAAAAEIFRVRLDSPFNGTFTTTILEASLLDNDMGGGSGEGIVGTDIGETIFGTEKGELIIALKGSDVVYAGSGDDVLRASLNGFRDTGDGNDYYDGGAGSDTVDYGLYLDGATITLDDVGGLATGARIGTDGLFSIENVIGTAGADTIRGNSAANVLDGGPGDDLLLGGAGADTFVFAAEFGNDRIADFDADPTGGQDLIDLGWFGIELAELDKRVTVADSPGGVLITVDANTAMTVLLAGVPDRSVITASDFLL